MTENQTPAGSRIIECTALIRGVIEEYPDGEANQPAKEAADGFVAEIETLTAAHSYVQEKVFSLFTWFDVLYSARKHMNYGGAPRVRMHIADDLTKIEAYVRSGRLDQALEQNQASAAL